MLRRHGIAALSTHEICPPSDAHCYLPDSHFDPATNERMARAMLEIIRPHLAPRAR